MHPRPAMHVAGDPRSSVEKSFGEAATAHDVAGNRTKYELNRIATARTQATGGTHAWGLEFGYDIWANLLSASVTQGSAPMLSVGVNTKNQINNSGFVYDAAGNLTADGSLTMTYDAENRMTSANAGISYTYDGDGRRVKKGTSKLYWYGAGADTLLETDASGNNPTEYVFFNGRRVARRSPSGVVNYYFADHLGSSRVVTNATGTILDDSDFYPFGGERAVTSTSGNVYKFTGHERDSETGLDYMKARYGSGGLARFLVVDPVGINALRLVNPQRLNLYSYAANNPLAYVDPDGRDAIAVNLVGQVPLGGHAGIVVVNAFGDATYARFGPRGGKPFGPGKVDVHTLGRVEFGPNGLPTDAAYQKLAEDIAGIEGQPISTVGFNYFRTSQQDSVLLATWMAEMWRRSNAGRAPEYQLNRQNCATFCIAGLIVGNAIGNKDISLVPNRLFYLLATRADENWTWEGRSPGRPPKNQDELKEEVTHRLCDADGKVCW
jgi:RHS repeat-associated protein